MLRRGEVIVFQKYASMENHGKEKLHETRKNSNPKLSCTPFFFSGGDGKS